MAGVAERAGVSVAAIYRRFENKDDLVLDTKLAVLGEIGDALEADVAASSNDIATVVRAYAHCLVSAIEGRNELMRVLIAQTNSPEVQSVGAAMIDRTKRILVDGILHRAEYPTPEFARAAETVWELLTFVPLYRVTIGSDTTRQHEHTEQLVSMAVALLSSVG